MATSFKVENKQFLIFANFRFNKGLTPSDGFSFITTSPIFQLDGDKFTLNQTLSTTGTVSVSSFKIDGNNFLAVGDSNPFATMKATIYRLQGGLFQEFQKLDSFKPYCLHFYEIGARKFLSVKWTDGISIYEWKNSLFVFIQNISPLTGKSVRRCTSFRIESQTFFVYGDEDQYNASRILTWDGSQFKHFQLIDVYYVDSQCFVDFKNTKFLAFASFMSRERRQNGTSSIYRWHDNKFVFFQSVHTFDGKNCNFFSKDGNLFLAMSVAGDNSTIYKLSGGRFEVYQRLNVWKDRHINVFEYNEELYLALSVFSDPVQTFINNTTSPVFKWVYTT